MLRLLLAGYFISDTDFFFLRAFLTWNIKSNITTTTTTTNTITFTINNNANNFTTVKCSNNLKVQNTHNNHESLETISPTSSGAKTTKYLTFFFCYLSGNKASVAPYHPRFTMSIFIQRSLVEDGEEAASWGGDVTNLGKEAARRWQGALSDETKGSFPQLFFFF